MKTTTVTPRDVEERWLVYDASEHVLGHMASAIAMALMGKDRPSWTPSQLTGAHVVVVNATKVRLSGRKAEQKSYRHYSLYPGGLKEYSLAKLLESRPNDAVILAVKRMLPRTTLGRQMLARLKVYSGPTHPHQAQKPVKIAGTAA
jgi:large subunit ribosomal protein L13